MSYDELKQAVIDKLIDAGFEQDGDKFTHIQVRKSQIVVNGVAGVQEHKIRIVFTVIGEGAIDAAPTVGLNLHVNDEDAGDFWIGNTIDLKQFFGIK